MVVGRVRRNLESHVGGGGGGGGAWSWVAVVVVVVDFEEKGCVPSSHVKGREESFERSSEWGVGA